MEKKSILFSPWLLQSPVEHSTPVPAVLSYSYRCTFTGVYGLGVKTGLRVTKVKSTSLMGFVQFIELRARHGRTKVTPEG